MSLTLRSDQSLITDSRIVKSYMSFLSALDTPVALGVFLRLKYGENDQVVTMSIDPKDYSSTSRFRLDYQAVNGLRKSAFLETTLDKQSAALKTFLEAEERCRVTNAKFDDIMYGSGAAKLLKDNSKMFVTLERAANLIKRILGPVPETLDFRFGPGVTSSIKKNVTTPKKYASNFDVTPELFPYSLDIMGPTWTSCVDTINLVPGGRIAFVPKDGKTYRSIEIVPHLNGYAQLGIGSHMRKRFRPWVDLNIGQEINRFLVSQAHEWRLATIDLSSASDTISRSLVWYLLPEEWVTVLDSCRSHKYTLDKGETWPEFHKFSSMGNGYTFELESIIFYALARAVGSSRVMTATYGDDIILEEHLFEDLSQVLEFCGFEINRNKSFCRSSFYESCGRDYFLGTDVRPFFWKENKPTMVFKMANDISRFARLDYGRNMRYRAVYDFIYRTCIAVKNVLIPDGIGDVGFVTDFDVAQPYVRRMPNGWCGFSIKALNHRPDKIDHSRDVCGLLSCLDRRANNIRKMPVPLETDISKSVVRSSGVYQVGRVTAFSQWTGYGPWIKVI